MIAFAIDGGWRLESLNRPSASPISTLFQVDKARLGECAELLFGLQEFSGVAPRDVLPVHAPQAPSRAMHLFSTAVHGQPLPVAVHEACAVINCMHLVGAHGPATEALADCARQAVAAHLRERPADAETSWARAQAVVDDQKLLAIVLPYLDEARICATLLGLFSAEDVSYVLCSAALTCSGLDKVSLAEHWLAAHGAPGASADDLLAGLNWWAQPCELHARILASPMAGPKTREFITRIGSVRGKLT